METLLPIQERYHELLHSNELDHILDQGIAKSREIAKKKYQDMAKKMGLER